MVKVPGNPQEFEHIERTTMPSGEVATFGISDGGLKATRLGVESQAIRNERPGEIKVAGGGTSFLKRLLRESGRARPRGGERVTTGAERGATRAIEPEAVPTMEDMISVHPRRTVSGQTEIRPATETEAQDFLTIKEDVEATATDEGIQPQRIEEGASFNFERIDGPDSMEAAIEAMAQVTKGPTDTASRGVMKFEAIEAMAKDLNMMPEVLGRRIGEMWPAEKMVAARQLMVQSARRLDDMAKKVAGGGATDSEMLAFRRQMALHSSIQMHVRAARTEIARSLASFRIPVSGSEAIDNKRIDEVLQQFGGRATTKELAEKYLSIEGRASRNMFARGTALARTRDVLVEWWMNALLSGFRTHIRNIFGNTFFQLFSVPEILLAGGIGAVRSGIGTMAGKSVTDRIFIGESAARAFGLIHGMRDGIKAGWDTALSGVPSDRIGKLEAAANRQAISAEAFNMTGWPGKAVDVLGTVINMPGRFLMAEDEFFKGVARRAELYEQAYREAMQTRVNGASIEDATDLLVDRIVNPDASMIDTVDEAARYWTFTNNLIGTSAEVQRMVNARPALRFVIPFIRTPVNILSAFATRNPIGLVSSRRFWQDIQAGGSRRDLAIARMSLGTGATAAAMSYAADGRITGGGPPAGSQEWKDLRATGWQPYSLVFDRASVSDERLAMFEQFGPVSISGDKIYVSYLGLEPAGLILGVAADTFDTMKWTDRVGELDSLAIASVTAVADNMLDRTYLEGLSNLFRLLDDDHVGTGGRTEAYLGKMAQSMVPKAVGALPTDPTLRDIRADPDQPFWFREFQVVLNGIQSQIPGLSKGLPAVRNLWGEEVRLGEGNWWEYFNPFYMSANKFSLVERELLRLDSPISTPRRDIRGVPLTPEQYSRYVELQGKDIRLDCVLDMDGRAQCQEDPGGLGQRESLEILMTSGGYGDAGFSDGDRLTAIRAVHADYLDFARERLMLEFPELIQPIEDAKLLAEEGILP